MTKRISCKVVRSVPLTKAISSLVDAHRLNNEHRSSPPPRRTIAVNVWHGRIMPKAGLTGQILDCYI